MIKKISETIQKTSGNITLLIAVLEKKGIVRREKDPDDRTKTKVKITKFGLKLIEKFFPYHSKIAYKVLSVLEPKDQQSLTGILKKLGKTNK